MALTKLSTDVFSYGPTFATKGEQGENQTVCKPSSTCQKSILRFEKRLLLFTVALLYNANILALFL